MKMPAPLKESFAEGAEKSAPEVMLNTPAHEELEIIKPEIDSVSLKDENQVKAQPVPKEGIEVVADRKGFYNGHRYNEGDSFVIRHPDEFGEWMKCVDLSWEKKRLEFYKLKKAKK